MCRRFAEALGIRPQSVYETAYRFGIHLKSEYWARARMIRLPPQAIERFEQQAVQLRMSPTKLMQRILVLVAQDDLFEAVLDRNG